LASVELRKTAKFACQVYFRSLKAELVEEHGAESQQVKAMEEWIETIVALKPQFENWT